MWIVLSTSWDLGDVRAALTIIISVLCSAGIWTLGYCFWRHQANHVAATASVQLYSLFSIQSVGDALDVLTTILWNQKLSSQLALLFQCTIVVVLSLAGAFAGPLAKWSTQRGIVVRNREVPGYLATSDFGSGASNFVKWNNTIERLKSSHFPQNQLLDFLPDIDLDWRYDKAQWNSSWKLDCIHTDRTEFELLANGNSSETFWEQMPALRDAYPSDIVGIAGNVNSYRTWREWGGFVDPPLWKDILWFAIAVTGWPDDNSNSTQWKHLPLRMFLVAYHIHNAPYAVQNDTGAAFIGRGKAERAAYTSIDCRMALNELPKDPYYMAHPWMGNIDSLLEGILQFHYGAMSESSVANTTVYHPGPEDLLRWTQAYMATKDTMLKIPAVRTLQLGVESIEVAFYAAVVLGIYVVLLSFAYAWIALHHLAQRRRGPTQAHYEPLRHHSIDSHADLQPQIKHVRPNVPRTKLDWLLQTVRESYGRDQDSSFFRKEREELEDDAKTSVYGDIDGSNGQKHIGVGRKSVSIPFSTIRSPLQKPPYFHVEQGWEGRDRSSDPYPGTLSMHVYSPSSYDRRDYFR